MGAHFHFQEQLDTHAGCNLVLNVTLQTVHLGAFLGICHHAVQLSFRVQPHWTDFADLSVKYQVELTVAVRSNKQEFSGFKSEGKSLLTYINWNPFFALSELFA